MQKLITLRMLTKQVLAHRAAAIKHRALKNELPPQQNDLDDLAQQIEERMKAGRKKRNNTIAYTQENDQLRMKFGQMNELLIIGKDHLLQLDQTIKQFQDAESEFNALILAIARDLISIEKEPIHGLKTRYLKISAKTNLNAELGEAIDMGQRYFHHLSQLALQYENINKLDRIGKDYKETQVLKKMVASDLSDARSVFPSMKKSIKQLETELKDVYRILTKLDGKIHLKIFRYDAGHALTFLDQTLQQEKASEALRGIHHLMDDLSHIIKQLRSEKFNLTERIHSIKEEILEIGVTLDDLP